MNVVKYLNGVKILNNRNECEQMSKERQVLKQEEIRNLILTTAQQIVGKDGISGLSIRKITNMIDYSPAIIYHYFKDKDEIINKLMEENYKKITGALSSIYSKEAEPEQKLKETSRKYIEIALQMPNEYMNIMLSSAPNILEHSSVLFNGASVKRQAIGVLCKIIKDYYKEFTISDDEIELTAQLIWTSTFGLITRIIIEKVPEEQRDKLINHHIKVIINGLLHVKSQTNESEDIL